MKYRYEEAQRAAEVFADEMKAKGNKYYYEFLAILESYERKIMNLEDKLVSSSTNCSETYDCGYDDGYEAGYTTAQDEHKRVSSNELGTMYEE